MFKEYKNQLTNNLLEHFHKVNEIHYHNVRRNNVNFKIRYCRTSQKRFTMCVIVSRLWNDMCTGLKMGNTVYQFKKEMQMLVKYSSQ